MKRKEAAGTLRALKNKLDEINYGPLQRSLRGAQYFFYPWPEFFDFENRMAGLPPEKRDVYHLLLLGKNVSRLKVECLFEEDLVEGLVSIGLLHREGEELSLKGLSITSYQGFYFIAEVPPVYPTYQKSKLSVYLGSDSYYLAQRMTVPDESSHLDLCTGTGIQAILGSRKAKKAVGVEISDVAVKIANHNISLNGLEEKVEIRKGDLFEPVRGETFDFISSNPPYMTVPSEIFFEKFGHGGEDGLEVIRKILGEIDDHLVYGGRVVISGWGIGTEEKPFVADLLEEFSGEKRFKTSLMLSTKKPLDYEAHRMAAELVRLNPMGLEELVLRLKKLYESLGAKSSYDFVTYMDKSNESKFEIIDLTNPWTKRDKPKLKTKEAFEETTQYKIPLSFSRGRSQDLLVGKQSVELLKFCNGDLNIMEVLEKYFAGFPSASQFNFDYMLNHLLDLCNHLEKGGVIERIKSREKTGEEEGSSFFGKIRRIF
jgi:SAM-dependent methyltransferase